VTSKTQPLQLPNDESLLRLRQDIHDTYTVPKIDFPRWVLERAGLSGKESILDVGTGSGSYFNVMQQDYPSITYVGVDTSLGLLRFHSATSTVSVGDAECLPFANGVFDVVMANHMLFHVPDIDKAIADFRRVLKPDGMIIAATNSNQTMPEFQALFRRALLLLSQQVRPNSPYLLPPHETFTLESGVRKLSKQFHVVVRHDLPSALIFSEVEPVMKYLDSLRNLREPSLPPDVTWEALMEAMHDQIQRVVTLHGELVVSKLSGVLIASNRSNFIQDYAKQIHKSTA
jgi:SAM-dependent methyltransferase